MNVEEAIDLLKKKDIEKIINDIKQYNLPVIHWKEGKDLVDKHQQWFINGDELIDFLTYNCDIYLHWTLLTDDLIDEIKKEIEYKVDD